MNDAEFLKELAGRLDTKAKNCRYLQDAYRYCDDAGRLTAIAERIEWRPIETAPTNESVLIFVPNLDHYGPGIYRAILVDMGTGRRWMTTAAGCGRDLSYNGDPTHWKPLDQPPEQP